MTAIHVSTVPTTVRQPLNMTLDAFERRRKKAAMDPRPVRRKMETPPQTKFPDLNRWLTRDGPSDK